MSKKIASGANGIVLDVKVGRGAYMKSLEEAESLTSVMIGIGQEMGRKMAAVISNMDQPLGNAVGNALEVIEAIETLRGQGPADFVEHCLMVSSQMLLIAGHAESLESAQETVQDALKSGAALSMFGRWIESQRGDVRVVDDPHSVLPKAKSVYAVRSPRSGWISSLNALEIGLAALHLGAGRTIKGQPVDHAVGIVLHHKPGDKVDVGDSLYTIHSSYALRSDRLMDIENEIQSAYHFSDTFVPSPPLIM